MLTGICYFLSGAMSGVASATFYVFVQHQTSVHLVFVYFYIVMFMFAGLGFIVYILVACLYTNRQRPMTIMDEEDETYIRLLYNTVLPT